MIPTTTPSPRRLAVLCLCIVVCGIAVGCAGGTSATTSTHISVSPTPPTSAPTTSTAQAPFQCGGQTSFDGVLSHQIGDMLVAPATLAIAAVKLPDDTPLTPLVVQDRITPSMGGSSPANPSATFRGGYTFAVCNRSITQMHTIAGVSMRIDTVTPYAGHLKEWPSCTGAYTRSHLPGAAGCGNPFDDYLQATFSAQPQAGTITAATQLAHSYSGINGSPPPVLGPLPVTLTPGQGLVISVIPVIPGASATYSFTLGVAVDSMPTAFVSSALPVLLAPVEQEYTGDACQTSPMQAQIPPAADPPVFYVCPVV
jgi:hypothetical protein